MTLREACIQAQRRYVAGGTAEAARARLDVFSLAVRRGVPYRQIAAAVGLMPSTVHTLLHKADTARIDPFLEPLEIALMKDAG